MTWTYLVKVVVSVEDEVMVWRVVDVSVMLVVTLTPMVSVATGVLVSVRVVEGVGAVTVKAKMLRAQPQALTYSAALLQADAYAGMVGVTARFPGWLAPAPKGRTTVAVFKMVEVSTATVVVVSKFVSVVERVFVKVRVLTVDTV